MDSRLVRYLKYIFLTALLPLVISCSGNNEHTASANIKLAAEMSLLPATVWIAEDQGYFTKHNVALTVVEFDSGRNALEAMLKDNSFNISTVAQTPVVFNSFNKEPYVIFATMAYSLDDIKVLARKDHQVLKPKDLKGKKIGATKRSTGHYFLEGFLSHYGYDLNDVSLIDINASKLRDSLEQGEVSAITSWEPHISRAEAALGKENLTMMISPTPFRKDFFFTSPSDFAKEHSGQLEQFLKALLDAEDFIKANPAESQMIIAKRLNADLQLIERIWDTFTFEISLEQSIMINLEDEAIWAAKLSNKQQNMPNYYDFIDIGPLTKVKPHGVNLIF
ncbi:MAG: hypothetical protein DRQ47_05570 [Gammaproteobacteria bacterium]|nr:MAG: hypothetical protein DRQ47_05570 [Gammaproteobacteria bacterium]